MCVVEGCFPSPICFSSTSHVKPDLKKKWGGCQFGPSTNSCTVLLKVLCISLINGALWLISPRGQIRIPQHRAAKLVWYCTFLTGYQQGCSSSSQDASHPLPPASPPLRFFPAKSVQSCAFVLGWLNPRPLFFVGSCSGNRAVLNELSRWLKFGFMQLNLRPGRH